MKTPTPATRRLTLSILNQLKETCTPAMLVERLGVSRATVHRGLALLMAEDLVVKTSQGPKASYRAATPQEVGDNKARQTSTGHLFVTMVMSQQDASDFQNFLELYSRMGIGQLEEIEAWLRFGTVKQLDGTFFGSEEVDQTRAILKEMKHAMMGLNLNESIGIYNSRAAVASQTTWAVSKALRHRLAWDRRPQGGMGVDFDEPMQGLDMHAGAIDVFSFESTQGPRVGIRVPQEVLTSLEAALSAVAMAFQGRVWECAEMFLTPTAYTLAQKLEGHLKDLDGQLRDLWKLQQLGESLLRGKPLAALESLQAVLSAAVKGAATGNSFTIALFEHEPVHFVELSLGSPKPSIVGVKDLPPNYFLGYKGAQFQILRADPTDDAIVRVGTSYSLQTAVLMARNFAGGQQGRSLAF